ncbi:MAG: anti-sigma factor family protein [Myxococcota bacterium]
MSHPSFFALDAYGVDPRAGDVEAHVKACPQCQAHVAAVRMPAPFPPALADLKAPPPRAPWWRVVALGFATAAVLLTVGVLSTREPPSAFTAKGAPSVALWLNRGGKVVAWTGQPVVAGDAVRIEVAPAGLTHVTVVDEHTRQVLYEAEVPDGAPTFTPAWAFDGQSPSESLRVVLSRGPVSAEALSSETCAPDAHCTRFTLYREAP